MKNILSVIVVALVLVAVVTGCGGMHRYDARLAAADSLMHDVPDSALALVQAVDPASLTREGDRAYRDLLLTQARYRCYITATSDSDINRALAYYRRHDGEREKLTRAYIYKGAVMEELGYPDSAMLYYKHAEATAAPTDYFNLGYVNMRMGSLYTDYYAFDGENINKYEIALDYLKQTDYQNYKRQCLNFLGCQYRESHPQKAEEFLKNALSISQQLNDSLAIIEDSHALIVLYSYSKNYNNALQLIHSINNVGCPQDISLYTSIANVYSHLGLTDSAAIILNLALKKGITNDEERLYYLESLREYEQACGNTTESLRLNLLYTHLSDSLLANEGKMVISKTENEFINNYQYNNTRNTHRLKQLLLLIALTALIILAVFAVIHILRLKKYQQIISELKKESDTQINTLNQLQENINKLKIVDRPNKDFVDRQLELLRKITVACYYEPQNKLGKQLKDMLQFNEHNRQNWEGIYDYIDIEYNNIMSKTRIEYPLLNDRDLLLLALTCLGFSYIQIAIIMGYSNKTSIGTLKNRLATKMELDCSLNEYISGITESNHD